MKKILALAIAISCLAPLTGYADSASQTSSVPAAKQVKEASAQADTLSEYIGEDAAKAAALEHSELTESDVTYSKFKLDYDERKWVYDIEYYAGSTQYDYEIDAYTGEIVSFDLDIMANGMTSTATLPNRDGTYIGLDAAKTIALEKANVAEGQVVFTEASLEKDDGMVVYQIDFLYGEMDYEFEINAITGDITEYDIESQYD